MRKWHFTCEFEDFFWRTPRGTWEVGWPRIVGGLTAGNLECGAPFCAGLRIQFSRALNPESRSKGRIYCFITLLSRLLPAYDCKTFLFLSLAGVLFFIFPFFFVTFCFRPPSCGFACSTDLRRSLPPCWRLVSSIETFPPPRSPNRRRNQPQVGV